MMKDCNHSTGIFLLYFCFIFTVGSDNIVINLLQSTLRIKATFKYKKYSGSIQTTVSVP